MTQATAAVYLESRFLMTHEIVASQTGSAADRHRDRPPDVLETVELRWFAANQLPDRAIRWFEHTAPEAELERRVDSYLLTGRPDLGVKRRDNGPLEVKERLGVGSRVSIGGRMAGRTEIWRKQTQNRSPVSGARWVDVAKTVLTYPYRTVGTGGQVSACDIELAAIETEGVDAWTLAFEASGPVSDRMNTLWLAVDRFLGSSDVPARVAAALELEAGYPAWLATVVGT